MPPIRRPNPDCVACDGEGTEEDAPSFQNSYGEHGLNPRPCHLCYPNPTDEERDLLLLGSLD